MIRLAVRNQVRGRILARRAGLADRFWLRLRGLAGRAALAPDDGLLLLPCRAVHMRGMRFPLDVAFLDRQRRVVALYSALAPGRRTAYHRDAWAALELASGVLAATDTRLGDTISWERSPES